MWLNNVLIFLLCYTCYVLGYTNNASDADQSEVSNLSNSTRIISRKCRQQLNEYEDGISNRKLWALQMLDSSAKVPSSGILRGNMIYLGDFDVCLNVSHKETIFGKYCLGALPLLGNNNKNEFNMPNTRMVAPDGRLSGLFAACLPDSCSARDFQDYYRNHRIRLNFFEHFCTSKSSKPELDAGAIATISLLAFVFYIVLMSTAYEAFSLYYMKSKPTRPILIAFSLITNTRKLLQTASGSGQISSLHGIRVISMVWIVVGHRYINALRLPLTNPAVLDQWQYDKLSMIIVGATVSVDTFLMLSGLLVSYGFSIATAKTFRFNIFVYYLHRFLRLTPLLAVVILIQCFLLKHLGDGPLWHHLIEEYTEPCRTYWWSALLYVQNYVNPQDLCMNHTWYLAVDTQLFLLSPLVIIPLRLRPKYGLILTGVLIVCSMVACFLSGWISEISGLMAFNMIHGKVDDFQNYYYFPPYTRAGPWLMGVILGHLIFQIKQRDMKITIKWYVSLFLWLVSLAILAACVFTGQNMLETTYIYDKFLNSVYLALLRPGWALGVCWVVFACISGNGGPVDWFLSLPIFQVASKLTYSTYLIHLPMIYLVSAQTRISIYFGNLEMMHLAWGDIAFSLATALILTLAFESPIIIIEKFLFGRAERPKQAIEQPGEPEERTQKTEISDRL